MAADADKPEDWREREGGRGEEERGREGGRKGEGGRKRVNESVFLYLWWWRWRSRSVAISDGSKGLYQ